jgi:hypothetical protein
MHVNGSLIQRFSRGSEPPPAELQEKMKTKVGIYFFAKNLQKVLTF